MSKKQLLVQEIIKYIIIFVMLYKAWGIIEHNTGLNDRVNDDSRYSYLLAACALFLTGTISAFVRLSYKDSINKNGQVSRIHVAIGDITVGLELFIVGILLIVSVVCVQEGALVFELGPYPLILACILYASLVFYDIYDLMNLAGKM